MRRSAVLAILAVLATLLLVAAPAGAHRKANHKEAVAIGKVVHTFIHKKHSPAPRDAKVTTITISTVNHSYGLVRLRSHKAGASKMLVHTRNHRWRVLGFANGAFSCSLAPGKIFKDLLGNAGACLPGGY